MIDVSLIVPVYNVENYLQRCLSSIEKQTYKYFETILIDDGSTDNSPVICDDYAALHQQTFVIHKKNEGLGMARNTGLDRAKGKFVLFVDSDDYIEADYIERLLEDAKTNNADTCIGGHKRVSGSNISLNKNPLAGRCFTGNKIVTDVLARMFGRDGDDTDYLEMSVWKVLFSNQIIKEFNIRFPSERFLISEDIIFDTDYYKHSKSVYMSDYSGYCYCDNDSSLTTKYRADRFEKNIVLYDELSIRGKQLGIYKLIKQRIMTNVVSIARYCIKHEVKYMPQIGKKEAYANIRRICNNECLVEVLNNYDQSKVKRVSRIINLLMKKKRVSLLIIVSRFKLMIGA